MSWPVYSSRLLSLYNQGGTFYQTIVPAGYTAVIKSVSASNWDAAAGQVSVAVVNTQVMYVSIPGVTGHMDTNMHHVAYAGEAIKGYCAHTNMSLIVSGFLLRNSAGLVMKTDEPVACDPPPGFVLAE